MSGWHVLDALSALGAVVYVNGGARRDLHTRAMHFASSSSISGTRR
jgi:hypothetical protein